MPGTVRYLTFGCKANQYDTQVLREALARHGWEEQGPGADLVVMNTCTVTAEAGRRARQLIRRIAKETPETRVLVTGCLAESDRDRLGELPGVVGVLGNGEAKTPRSFLAALGIEVEGAELDLPPGITEFAGHTRAFLKIQDGCDMSCAFCIIPSVRGPSRSRPLPELAQEVRRLVESGHREVVLTGIHIGHWGRDLGLSFAHLLEGLTRVRAFEHAAGGERGEEIDWRLRLSSIEATEITAEVLEVLARHPRRIAPHLHMPLQSGDDRVLAAMNRWYRSDEYLAACDRIRAVLEQPAFTSDVIIGFPGEDERAFESTLETVRCAGFSGLHVFPFSPRPGTAAADPARLGRPVDPDARRERRARLTALSKQLQTRFRRSLAGRRETLVLEGSLGLAGRYERVHLEGPAPVGRGALVDVELALLERRDEQGRALAEPAPVELLGRAVPPAPATRGASGEARTTAELVVR